MIAQARARTANFARPSGPTRRSDSGAPATRDASRRAKGTGAPSLRLRHIFGGLLAALLAMVAMAFSAASASADPPHTFLGNFGSIAAGGTGSEPTFTEASGMAVDQATGDLLVISFPSGLSGIIKRYKPDGTADSFSALGTNVIDGKRTGAVNECPTVPADCDETGEGTGSEENEGILTVEAATSEAQIAVAPPGAAAGTAGNIYATDAVHAFLDVFSPTGQYLTHLLGAGGTFSCGVAVAPNGDVFIGDWVANKVYKFTPSGPSSFTQTGAFTTPHPCQVAATEGFVFASELEGPVKKIDSEGAEEGTTKYTVDAGPAGAVNVDPFDGHLYVGIGEGPGSEVKEYDVSGASPILIEPSIELLNSAFGVAIDEASGNVYVTRFAQSKVEVYGPRVPRVTPEYKLNLSTTGGEGGTFQCDTGPGPGACAAEYEEGTVVTVTVTPNPGSVFTEFTGDCGPATCEVTMSGEKSVVAHFTLASESFTATPSGAGTGTIECEDNGGGLGACAASYLYGHTIKVVATPAFENELASLTGTGSAAGNCSVGTKTCEFVITAASSVTAQFELESRKDQTDVNTVHGDVVQDTILESSCSEVDLTPGPLSFLPGVEDDYNNTCNLTLTSTGEQTTLTASDESAIHKGHLVQEYAPNHLGASSYFLLSALEAKATDSQAKGGVHSLAALSPVTLLTFTEPISKDPTTLEFNQHIGPTEGLHHGVYSKMITLTLYQTTP